MSALDFLKSGLSGFLATFGFALWFSLPKETLLRASFVGMGGFLVRTLMIHFGQSVTNASFFGALFIGIFGYYRARSFHYPRVIFTVTAIIPLVPGASLCKALLLLSTGKVVPGLESAVQASMTVAALAAALVVARTFTFQRD
jgi:uncharacterized membrane protein YjjB (DUF3815 family)